MSGAGFEQRGERPHPLPDDGSWGRELRAALSETAPIWWLLGVYTLLAILTARFLDVSLVQSVLAFLPFVAGLMELTVAFGAAILVLRIAVFERPADPLRRFREELDRYTRPDIVIRAVLLLATSCSLQLVYGFFKPLIPRLVPYTWDPVFSAADRLLFLGHQPWEILWPLLGHATTIFALNVLYNLWFFWMLLTWALTAFTSRHRAANTQYFFAHVLLWSIGGTAMAIAFAAAGPCYYGDYNAGADPYSGLMVHLFAINHRIPVFSLAVQAMLWDGQIHPDPAKLAGISALPSLHVGAAVLRTRIAFVHSRRLGWVSAVATFVIFLASIVLAWHYAMDGIVGTALALVLWLVAGRILAWRNGRSRVPHPAIQLAPS